MQFHYTPLLDIVNTPYGYFSLNIETIRILDGVMIWTIRG